MTITPRLHVARSGFLSGTAAAQILDYAIANEQHFRPSKVGATSEEGGVNPSIRISARLEDPGWVRQVIESAVQEWIPEVVPALGINSFEPSGFETEIVATGAGGYYRRHIDLLTGAKRSERNTDRIVSVVYYIHREPRRFAGGQLRLYPMWGAAEHAFQDVIPEHNTAVAFSSWVPHEVLPVTSPSQAFADSRFTVNCWIHRSHGTENKT